MTLGLVAGCSTAGVSPTATATATAMPTALTREPSPAPVLTSTPAPESFVTPGAIWNWSGFTWNQLPSDSPLVSADPGARLVTWAHGYVIYSTTGGGERGFVFTSADGETWTHATAIVAPQVLVAASTAGLVAVGSTTPSETVWTSADGVNWHDAGSPSGLSTIDSLPGTSAGFVATGHDTFGSGKFATGAYGVEFSADGIDWSPVQVQARITWDEVGPAVQAGNNRFFVMGGYADSVAEDAAFRLDAFEPASGLSGTGIVASGAPGKGGLWWSDDGRTWHGTGDWAYASSLVFGRDGILAYESPRLIPGYIGLDLSTDGGKTWTSAHDGPVGAVVCVQGECTEGPDGGFASNGAIIVALKSNGRTWVSFEGKTWTALAGVGRAPTFGPFLVLPRGIIVGGAYGAAK
jgi:hypothetical protein